MKLLSTTAALLIATSANASEIIHQKTLAPDGSCAQTIFGTAGSDTIDESANTCDLTVFALGGDDVIITGSGNDIINGGGGADNMIGNGGRNTYSYTDPSDSTPEYPDFINDFKDGTAGDTIDLSAICARATTGCTFIGTNQFTGHPGQVRYGIGAKRHLRLFAFVLIDELPKARAVGLNPELQTTSV